MSAPPPASGELITDHRQLVEYLEQGCRPASAWRVGTEHEKFPFRQSDLRPLPYEGPDGIRAILNGLTRFGWQPVFEGKNVIALERGQATISLEPGGQFELSGAPLETIHQTRAELDNHLDEVHAIEQELGIGMLGLGFQPKWRREDIPWMPKGRYAIMRRYMPMRGSLGLDMMLRTCTVQANLDFSSEADMVQKMRVSLALQPVVTALFANSPFVEGKPSGFQSYRAHIWTDTDPDRTGDLSFAFEVGFGFERYVEYALDVPMYFVYRNGTYIDAAGQSFRDFLDGKLPALPGERPTLSDWINHLSTLFPEVRLKRYLEMRGADCGSPEHICALSALWVGLLYDGVALDAASELVKDWTNEDRATLRRAVPRLGLQATVQGRFLQETARHVVEIARNGLKLRAQLDEQGQDESHFLDFVIEIVETGRTPALKLVAGYGNSADGVFNGNSCF